MISITIRNLKIFFRDKSAVFFSFLGVIIIIGLYVIFLGDTIIAGDLENLPKINFLIDSWVMAGVLAVTSITTTMGAFGIMVDDRAKKNLKDFQASPLKRYQIAGGYVLSAFLIGVITSIFTFILAEVYIIVGGGELLPFISMVKVLGLILLSVLSSSAMVYFIVTFFKSNSAFATASTVIGTLVGFLTGIYIPIGSLPEAVQWAIKLFPVSHAGVLLRQVMVEEPLKISFANAPEAAIISFKEQLGVVFTYGDYTATAMTHIIVLILTAAVFYGLAILNVSRKSK